MKRKKIIFVGLIIVIIVIITIAILNKKKDQITIATWDSNLVDSIKKSFIEFNKNHDYEVVVTSLPWDEYWVAVDNAITNESGIDIFIMHTDKIEEYAKSGKMLKMDDILTKDDLKNYESDLINLFSYQGSIYGIPLDISSIGLFYNKEIFDDKKVSYPTNDWTWEDLVETSKLLNDDKKEISGFLAECWGEDGYYNTIFQNKGFIYNEKTGKWGFNENSASGGLKYYYDFIYKYGVSLTPEEIGDLDTNDLFTSGKVAMFFRGSWELYNFKFNEDISGKFGVVELPKGKIEANTGNATVFSSYTDNKNIEKVKEVLLVLKSDELYKNIANDGISIPANINYRNLWAEQGKEFGAVNLVNSIKHSKFMPSFTGNKKWKDIESEEIYKIFINETNLKNGLDKIYEELKK